MEILIEQEITLHQVQNRTNQLVLKQLLHPDFREIGESGNSYDYNQIVSFLENEQRNGDIVQAQDFECIFLAVNTRLLLYKSAVLSSSGEYTSFAKRSSIWVESNGQRRMQYHQGTKCEPFAVTYHKNC